MRSICAIGLVLAFFPGCALSHLRADPTHDAAAPADAAVPVDAAFGSCSELWLGLPWCPAVPSEVIGQHCDHEGLRCGFECCEASPPVECRGGVWIEGVPPDCSTVDCAQPPRCGAGSCEIGSVCVHPSTEVLSPDRCVIPPAPMRSCGEAPPGSLQTDIHTCTTCSCAAGEGVPEITVSCECCDSASAPARAP